MCGAPRGVRSALAATSFPLVPKIVPLAEAVAGLVRDGDTVALEGFTHLIPFAAGHEIIRQGLRDLTLVRMTPDVIYDQLIGAGCAAKLVFSWGGNPGVGSLHRMRDALTNAWPVPARDRGAQPRGHGQPLRRRGVGAAVRRPARVRGHRPAPAHAHDRDRHLPVHRRGARRGARRSTRTSASCTPSAPTGAGNVQLWGIVGVQKEVVLASRRALVTVEEIVDELTPVPGRGGAAALGDRARSRAVPGGAAPSYAQGYYDRDNAAYRAWDAISRDRATFGRWLGDLREVAA